MIRIQTQSDRTDPAEEKRKTRENVIGNVATFALLIVLIRSGMYLAYIHISNVTILKIDYTRETVNLPTFLQLGIHTYIHT
jgi:hypothetical protein